MNIYANKGDKIVFTHPNAGYEHHQEIAAKHLKPNETYTVEETIVDGWHTDVFIQEVPGVAFNSVLFEDAPNTPTNPPEFKSEYRVTRVGNFVKRSGSKTLDGKEAEADHPNIALNTVYEGNFVRNLPKVGERIIFAVDIENGKRTKLSDSLFMTTPVEKIENHFYYTKNSVYKVEKLQTK